MFIKSKIIFILTLINICWSFIWTEQPFRVRINVISYC
ncbi:unnamed protein product [Schistosoma mattheei]|uniref:Uncharacterized protein n=1 Tax=Schistosoma mattheei TaxID=31246 RepID=A0A3P8G3M4_9TREM|nr:unnamed protein product [Schistosoma mattheei]